jgi:glycine/D-amino acid oxidase-like deaminating enzyme
MAATELLPEDLLASIIPARRTVLDTNTNIDFFRPAPDSPRLLFGGDTGCGLTEDRAIEIRLCQILTSILPQLAGIRLANVWTGLCAGTFDMMPHIGGQDRVWYAMGYNYAGVPMGGYLGAKLAYKILGRAEGESVFGRSKFPTLPFYRGNAWFTPLVMRYFDLKDGKKRRTSAASQNTNHLN